MKLLHFFEDNQLYLGIQTQKGILNVNKTVAANNSSLPTTLEEYSYRCKTIFPI